MTQDLRPYSKWGMRFKEIDKMADQDLLSKAPENLIVPVQGQDFLNKAAQHLGEDYVYGTSVDLDDPEFSGPWDCAEFVSWVVKQVTGKLYGCLNPQTAPDPWTGAWFADMHSEKVKGIPIDKANNIPGAILLRFSKAGHHIVFADGKGGTIEAMGTNYGVTRGHTAGREWDYGILIPGVKYEGVPT